MVSVKQFYTDEWKRFKEKHLKIFLIILVLFVIVVVLSYVFLMSRPDQGYQRIVELQKVLREIIPEHITGYKLFLAIFLNNLRASFVSILLGLIPFLFLPILGVLRNGFILGAVTVMASLMGWKVASYVMLCYIAPHGIFELPAMLYSISMGVFLSLQITKKILNIGPGSLGKGSLFDQEETQEESVFAMIAHVFRSWISVVVPLLPIGALVEAFITGNLFSIERGIPSF